MELHDKDMPYDEAWARRVITALGSYYNGSALSIHMPEYAPWMLTPLRTAASAFTPEHERQDVIGELYYKLGVASMRNQWRVMADPGLSAQGFQELLLSQLFLQALPLTVDRAGVRFSVKDYIALQEKFGDEGILAGKLKAVGIDPKHVQMENGMFVLPRVHGERLLAFLEGKDALEVIYPVDVKRRQDWKAKDEVKLQRYYAVMPHVLTCMRRGISADYMGLFHYAPDALSHLLSVDATPAEDGFAEPTPQAGMRAPLSRDMLFSSLKAYNENRSLFGTVYHRPTTSETEWHAHEDMHKLTGNFAAMVRAHMCVNQLSFHSHVQAGGIKEQPVEALSVDTEQLGPWMQHCHVSGEAQFFALLGISATPYAGHKDPYNVCAARVVITDPRAIAYLKELGAQVTQAPIVQMVGRLRSDRPAPDAGKEASVLEFREWGRRVEERKKARSKGENPSSSPVR